MLIYKKDFFILDKLESIPKNNFDKIILCGIGILKNLDDEWNFSTI